MIGELKLPNIYSLCIAQYFGSPMLDIVDITPHSTVVNLQGILLEILMVLSNFKPKNHHFGHFYSKKLSKIHKIGDFGCKNQQNSNITNYPLVPQIYHPVAL